MEQEPDWIVLLLVILSFLMSIIIGLGTSLVVAPGPG